MEHALRKLKLPRSPWNREKDIWIPTDGSKHQEGNPNCECCRYDATVRISDFWFKRLTGKVREIYVFEKPLQMTTQSIVAGH